MSDEPKQHNAHIYTKMVDDWYNIPGNAIYRDRKLVETRIVEVFDREGGTTHLGKEYVYNWIFPSNYSLDGGEAWYNGEDFWKRFGIRRVIQVIPAGQPDTTNES